MSGGQSPAVSVIIPCYKVTAYVREALDSVMAQTFRDFEVIVVNDGCPDTANLEGALRPYLREIVYIKQDNLGVSGARNAGIRAARASVLAFLDGDDIWEPEYLQCQFSFLQEDPGIDLVYPNAVLLGHRLKGSLFMDLFPSQGEVTLESLVKRRCHVTSSLMARREIILRAGGYDLNLRSCEDLDLWIRVAKIGGRFAYHSKPLYRYRIHGRGLASDTLGMQRNLVAMLEAQRRTLDLLPHERQWFDEELAQEQGALDFLLGRRELYAGNRAQALEYLTRASRVVRGRNLPLTVVALRFVPRLLFRYVHHRYPTERAFLS